MTYKTHINFGILFAILFMNYLYYNKYYALTFIAISAIVSLIPDMDHNKSFISNKISPLIFILVFIMIRYNMYNLCILIIWIIITKFSKHRTFSHSILGTLIFCIPFYNTVFLYPVFIGYVSHLIADMFTINGIPLLYPFNNKKISIFKITVGSTTEHLIYYVLLIINISFIIRLIFKHI